MEEKLDKLLKRQTVLIGVVILLGAALMLAHTTIRRLDDRMTQMQNTVGQLDSRTQQEIQNGLSQMQNILDQQASMLADGRISIGSLNTDGEEPPTTVDLAVVPKQVAPGAVVSVRLLDDAYPDWSMTLPATLAEDGLTYTATATIPLIEQLRVQMIVEKNGVKTVEYLPWYEPVRDRFLMEVSISRSGSSSRRGAKTEWNMDFLIHCYDKFYDDRPDQYPVSGTLTLVKNGEAVQSSPISFEDMGDISYEAEAKMKTAIPVAEGDQVEFVVEVLDNHGFTYRHVFPEERDGAWDIGEESSILYNGRELTGDALFPQKAE